MCAGRPRLFSSLNEQHGVNAGAIVSHSRAAIVDQCIDGDIEALSIALSHRTAELPFSGRSLVEQSARGA